MEFKKYQHVERLGTSEVSNIMVGDVYVFPKIDGTNASVWLDGRGNICAGSRTRTLSLEKEISVEDMQKIVDANNKLVKGLKDGSK